MTPAEMRRHVLRHLDKGPLYVGALPVVTGLSEAQVYATVRALTKAGQATRNAQGTVTITEAGHVHLHHPEA